MNNPYRDTWLVLAAAFYAVLSFWLLLFSHGWGGLFWMHPIAIPMQAVGAIAVVIVLRLTCVRLRWVSIAVFAEWVLLVAWLQILIYAQASASV